MFKIYIMNGPQRGRSYDTQSDTIYLGRASDNDIQIEDNYMSRKHLKIFRKNHRYFIVDLGTKNGTFINDKKIGPGEVFEVEQGTSVRAGKTIIRIGEGFSEHEKDIPHFGTPIEHSDTEDMDLPNDMGRPMTHPKTMELIYNVSNALMSSLNITEILNTIMDSLFKLLKRVERGAILLTDSESGKLKLIIAKSKYQTGQPTLNYSRTVVSSVINQGQPIMIPDTSAKDPDELSDSMERIRSVMCVPLISKSKIRGVIYVDSLSAPHGFRKEDLSLLISLSSPAAIAIENALLYSNSEARFKAMFDHMSSGAMAYKAVGDGEDFILTDLNRAAQEIERIEKSAALGKSILEVSVGIRQSKLLKVFKRVWQTGKAEQLQMGLKKDGRTAVWREYRVYRMPSGEIVSVFDDVTEKKKAEARERALQERLFAAQKMESIGTLAGGTAHNFRNILQAISGNVEYIQMTSGEKPEINESIRAIMSSIEKGVDLITSLLRYSKWNEEFEFLDLDLADVILKTYEIVHRVFDKRIQIDLKLEKNLFVKGDHSLLSQVFMNCFTNAQDAMPSGGLLSIEAKKEDDKVVVAVSDTGHGMDEGTSSKIFDPFFTLKPVGKGTGLGLSVTKGIIDQHKGSIEVSSELGRGTTFKICLPLSKMQETEKTEPETQIISGTMQKVLIVDDDHPVLDALTKLIRGLGYRAIPVDEPAEALKNYKRWAPDIVLVDRSMPAIDGMNFIKKIVHTDPNSRIIIISGYEESSLSGIDESIKSHIKGYITKPCGIKELSSALSQALK